MNGLEHFSDVFETGQYEALNDGASEYFDCWLAGYLRAMTNGAPNDILLVLPSLALSFDAIQTALNHEFQTVDGLKAGIVGEQRNGTIIGLADNPDMVIDGIANGTISHLGEYARHFDIKPLLAHVNKFLAIRRNANSPSVYEILTHQYHVPEYTIPLYVAVDDGARFPAYKSETDAKNVLTRLTGKTEHGTDREERTRTEMFAVAGYANVLATGRRVARIRYEAHTNHMGETWAIVTAIVDFRPLIKETATA